MSRRLAIGLVCLVAGCLIAACGSSSSGSSSSSSSTSTTSTTASAGAGAGGGAGGAFSPAKRAQLVSCLKSHGVTLPSRPAGAGGAGGAGGGTGTGTSTTPRRRGLFFGAGGAGGAAANPKMLAAFKACGVNFGAGRGGFRGRISHTTVTKYVTCVRQHGYNLPSPNFSGKGPIFPASIESNAKFQAASKPCQSLLIPPRGSAPPGGGSSSSGA
jgi:hypothetical protein